MSTDNIKFTLYSYWRSSCSWRVRTVLALKGIKYEYVAVPLLKKAQNSEEYSSLNPMEEIPTLVVSVPGKSDIVLSQSLAIIEYLEFLVPLPSVYSRDHVVRAQIVAFALDIATGIQPIQNLKILQRVQELSDAPTKVAWGKDWITKGLAALERKASKYSTKFLLTNYPSIADVCLIPQLYNARRFDVDMTQFPRLLAVEKECEEMEAFKASHPNTQPDADKV